MTTISKITVLAVPAVVFTALLVLGVFIGGTAVAQQMSGMQQAPGVAVPGTAVVSGKVTMADVDNALSAGPVFLEFESKDCSYCKQQRPVSEALARNYPGKVTFFFADASASSDLARAFQVYSVPQIDVIAKKTDGTYLYVGKDGATSNSIGDSKFLGPTSGDDLSKALDKALALR